MKHLDFPLPEEDFDDEEDLDEDCLAALFWTEALTFLWDLALQVFDSASET